MNNIALIGMPGSFKSSAGKLLAEKLSRTFIDTDELYEKTYNEKISHTFSNLGEAVFRDRETLTLKDALKQDNIVLSTGGGIILRQENVTLLRQNCMVVLLDALPETLFERLENDETRPLIAGDAKQKLSTLYLQRIEKYKASADIIIDTNKIYPKDIVDRIIDKLQ